MADLISLTIVITFFYALHQLVDAVRNRRTKPEESFLDHLQFDPSRHELAVLLKDGRTITGTPDERTGSAFSDGLLLTDAREAGQQKITGSSTYIPARNISAVAVRDRNPS